MIDVLISYTIDGFTATMRIDARKGFVNTDTRTAIRRQFGADVVVTQVGRTWYTVQAK